MIRTLLPALIRKYKGLFLSMVIASSLGIAMMIGLSCAYRSLDYSFSDYVQGSRYADAVILTDFIDKDNDALLRTIPGVKTVNSRIIADTHVRLPSGRTVTVRGLSYGIRDFQEFHVWDMNENADYPNVSLEFNFAERNNIHAGDLLEVRIGEEQRTVCIGSIVSSAECLAIQPDAFSAGETPDFGYMFVPEEMIYGTEYYSQSNQFLLRFDEWADPEAVLDNAKELLGDAVISSYPYKDSGVNKRIEFNLIPLSKLTLLIPSIFFINMIAVVSLFLSQILRQSRRDIGILRALGFEKSSIRKLFCAITLCVTAVACVIGFALGVGLMFLTSNLFANIFPLPKLYYIFDPLILVLAAVITIAAGQFSAILGTGLIARIDPSEAMSREVTAAKTDIGFLDKLFSKGSPTLKYCATTVFRNKKRFLFSVICVASSLSLILTAIAFHYSKNGILTQLFNDRIHYDCQIYFREEPTEAQLAVIRQTSGVSEVQDLNYYRRPVEANGKKETILLAALPLNSTAVSIPGGKDGYLPIYEDGIILEKHAAVLLNVNVGDTVRVDGIAFPVAAISDQSINRCSYLSLSEAALLGRPDQHTVVCNTVEEMPLLTALSEFDSFSHADFTEKLYENLEGTFATYSIGVVIITLFSMMLGVIVVFNTMQTNLLEQKKELSVLRAIGFQISSISNIWLVQSGLQFLLACCIGLPVGLGVTKYSLAQMATENREYPLSDAPGQWIITILLVALYILVSHYAAMRTIRKWDIAENTKEKE